MSSLPLEGVFTALATPFDAAGAVDFASFERLVRLQLAARVAGVVVLGTTGESPTVTADEGARLLADAVRLAAGSGVLVVAGTGSNDTAATVAATRAAAAAGAAAALVVVPYYSRPTQAGLLAHFAAVARDGGLPVIVYNIPGRAAVALAKETLVALAALPGVAGVKDATGGLDLAADLALAAPRLRVLSGDDALTLPFLSLGAVGAVSVVSNVFPAASAALVAAARAGDFARARALHEALLPFARAAFVESNPAPVKHALAVRGVFATAALRLPLAALAEASRERVDAGVAATEKALRAMGVAAE